MHVNVVNGDPTWRNRADPVSGYAGIPRNMTCIAEKLKTAGCKMREKRTREP